MDEHVKELVVGPDTSLTPDEIARFGEFVNLVEGHFADVELALTRATLDDDLPVAVVIALSQPDPETYRADPVAILVDDALMRRLDPGDGVEVANVAEYMSRPKGEE